MTRSPLDLDLETMRRLGHRVADIVAEHLATVRDERVIDSMSRAELGDRGRRVPGDLRHLQSELELLP